jgi:hypothetical protein
MSAQIDKYGAIQFIDVLLNEDTRRIRLLTKALAKLGCSCTTRTAEVELEAHQIFCRYRMKMEDMQ